MIDLSNDTISEITFLCIQKYNQKEHNMVSYDWIRKNWYKYLEIDEIKVLR